MSTTNSISPSTSSSSASSTTTNFTMTTTATQTVMGTPAPTGNNNPQANGASIATSASLYLYTFLATLVLLLTVSAAIVVRSFLLRRRHRLMVEEAIRNGTWVPPAPPTRPARVDLSKKPVLWEAYVDDKGGVSAWNSSSGADHWRAEHSKEWDTIKPFSAAYVSNSAEAIAAAAALATSHSTHSLPTNGLGTSPSATSVNRSGRSVPGNDASANSPASPSPAEPSPATSSPSITADPHQPPRIPRHRAFLQRAIRVLSPTPAPTSPLPAPVTSGAGQPPVGQREVEHAMAEVHQRSASPNVMRVAVLIAMPTPPSTSASSSRSVSSNQDLHADPLRSNPRPALPLEDDEHPLPHLEVGVAEVLMVPTPSPTPYSRAKREVRDSVVSRESDTSEV